MHVLECVFSIVYVCLNANIQHVTGKLMRTNSHNDDEHSRAQAHKQISDFCSLYIAPNIDMHAAQKHRFSFYCVRHSSSPVDVTNKQIKHAPEKTALTHKICRYPAIESVCSNVESPKARPHNKRTYDTRTDARSAQLDKSPEMMCPPVRSNRAAAANAKAIKSSNFARSHLTTESRRLTVGI